MYIGIDFGTTNSVMSVVYDGDKVPSIIKIDGLDLLPSCVSMTEDGYKVGYESVKYKGTSMAVSSFKRKIGENKSIKIKRIDGKVSKFVTPIEMATEVFKIYKAKIDSLAGKKIKPTIVVSVPAQFSQEERSNILKAANKAGLKIKHLINEPTAAALCYLSEKDEEKILVFDLGGGTFDLSLLSLKKVKEKRFYEVKKTWGSTQIGGDDIDAEILRLLLDKVSKKLEIGIHDSTAYASKYLSKREKENFEKGILEPMKIDLNKSLPESKKMKYKALIENCKNNMFSLATPTTYEIKFHEVCRSKHLFSTVIFDLNDYLTALLNIFSKIDKVIVEGGLDEIKDFNGCVVLVGGSTKNRYIEHIIQAKFPKAQVFNGLSADLSISMGAAIQAQIYGSKKSDIIIRDVTPFSIGIRKAVFNEEGVPIGSVIEYLIPKDTMLPATITRAYSVVSKGQKEVEIQIYTGSSPSVDESSLLGILNIDISKFETPFNFLVTLTVNLNGMLTCEYVSEYGHEEVELNSVYVEPQALTFRDKQVNKWKKFIQSDSKLLEKFEGVNDLTDRQFANLEKKVREELELYNKETAVFSNK